MDEDKIPYMHRMENSQPEINSPDYTLPQWVKNLKNYFEKKRIENDYYS